jgi:hypothetical protein
VQCAGAPSCWNRISRGTSTTSSSSKVSVWEPWERGTSSVGSRYQARKWSPWLRTLVCVWWCFVNCNHDFCVEVSKKSDYQSKRRL